MSNNVKNNVTTKTLAEMNEEFAEAVAKAEFSASVRREVARRHRASGRYHTDMMDAAIDKATAKIYRESRFVQIMAKENAVKGTTIIKGLTLETLEPEVKVEAPKVEAPKVEAPKVDAPNA